MRDTLGEAVLGVYLHGSAVPGGLRRLSDLDLVAVTARRTTGAERAALATGLLALSAPYPPEGDRRPLELTVFALPDLSPWGYPPPTDFQYGEWLRAGFERGIAVPWVVDNPDAAMIVAAVRARSEVLLGRPARELLEAVPRADLLRATLDSIPALSDDLPWDTRNVVLTFARMWVTAATGELVPKDAAAAWAARRLAPDEGAAVDRARQQYLVGESDKWDATALAVARRAVEAMIAEIRREAGSPQGAPAARRVDLSRRGASP